MISGFVSSHDEAIIELNVRGPGSRSLSVEAVIDTGFNRSLTLPHDQIEILGLEWRSRGQALLADGTVSVFDVYDATVGWNGEQRSLEIHEADSTPLVGMELIKGYELRIQVTEGGAVTLERLS